MKLGLVFPLALLGCSAAVDDGDTGAFGLASKSSRYTVQERGPTGATLLAYCDPADRVSTGGFESATTVRVSQPTTEPEPPHREGWMCVAWPGNPEDVAVCTARCER